MKKDEPSLESILKKATTFSEKIDKLQDLSKDISNEKEDVMKKEHLLHDDLFQVADEMYKFLQETISIMTDLYARVQSEAETPSPASPTREKKNEEVVFEVQDTQDSQESVSKQDADAEVVFEAQDTQDIKESISEKDPAAEAVIEVSVSKESEKGKETEDTSKAQSEKSEAGEKKI